MIKSLAGGILAALLILITIGLCLPSTYQIETTTSIQSSLEETYTQISTLRKWKNWAYDDSAAMAILQYEGPESGLGAIYSWHDEHSTGRMEIIEEELNKRIVSKLISNYGVLESQLAFTFSSDGVNTSIKWIQSGDVGYDFRARFFIWLGGLENSIGQQNKAALERLKQQLEENS